MLKQRKLGGQGLTVSEIGLGCMSMTGIYGTPDEAEAVATLERALALGCTFFDTAEAYGRGQNEELLGRVLAPHRHGVVIATKFGIDLTGETGTPLNSRPAHIRKVADESLRRLRTDYIDLFYQHRADPNVPIEDVAGTVRDLIAAGKVRHFGLSEVLPDTLRRAHAVQPVSALQSEYSLFERGVESDVLPTCRALGIGFVPYSPLSRGFLTGAMPRVEDLPPSDWRVVNYPRIHGTNYDANMRLAGFVREIAQRRGISPAQLALAWLLQQGADIVPIPGTQRRKYLEDNLAAARVTLSAVELAEIDRYFADHPVAGARYTAAAATRAKAR